VFQHEIAGAVRVWSESTAYNHCFLVLPLIATLLWKRRDVISRLRPTPSWWALALVPALSVAWGFAALADILEIEQLVTVGLFETLLIAVLGWHVFRALMAPLLFLFFLVPFGAFLTPLLQLFTTSFTVRGLELLGIPVFADRFTIQIPAGVFEVAEACAGLRFLIASFVFGCFFSTVVYRSKFRRIVFIGLSGFVPVVANGLRALGLVLLAHVDGAASAALADHVIYGWIFFAFVMLLLIIIGLTFADGLAFRGPSAVKGTSLGSPLETAAIASAGLLLALIGPSYVFSVERVAAAPAPRAAASAAPQRAGWVLEPLSPGGWLPSAYGADHETTAIYRNGDAMVTEFVALYRLPVRGSLLTRTTSSVIGPEPWRHVETGNTPVRYGHRIISVNTAKIAKPGHQRVIWWFYLVNGQATSSSLKARLLQARAALTSGAHLGALVALSADMDDRGSEHVNLASFLKAFEPGIGGRAVR
jgi:exosortase A